jgi:hypothetical protein
MIQDLLSSPVSILIFGVSFFTFIMFLPALFELKRPKDAGPRRIAENDRFVDYFPKLLPIESQEEFVVDKSVIKRLGELISALPDLEG